MCRGRGSEVSHRLRSRSAKTGLSERENRASLQEMVRECETGTGFEQGPNKGEGGRWARVLIIASRRASR